MIDEQIKKIKEQIRKDIQRKENIRKKYGELQEKYKAKEQECEELKAKLKEMNEVIRTETTRCSLVYFLQTDLDQLKAENEELKMKNSILEDEYKILEDNLDSRTRDFEDIIDGYKQTFTEIKEIARVNSINTCWTAINLCVDCDETEECGLQSPFEKLKAIIQKISEVEDET